MRVTGFLLLFISQVAFCQKDSLSTDRFVKPIILSFTNFHTALNKDSLAFQQEKLIVGVNFRINENWSGRLWLDVIRHDDNINPDRLTPFIKPGYVSYHKNKFTCDAGIFFGSQFYDQNSKWGNRYIYRTFQAKQDFGWSADLGIRGKYEVTKNINIDAGILNGAGYRNIGLSIPLKWFGSFYYSPIEGIFIKAYADTYRKDTPQSTFASFIDYRKDKKYSFSLEYNYKWNYKSYSNHNRYGVSAYSTIYFLEQFAIISRVDKLYLNEVDQYPDILDKPIENTIYILGLQYQPLKQVRIALDYQNWGYKQNHIPDNPWFYVHLEYRMM